MTYLPEEVFLSRSAYGELAVEIHTPTVQIDSVYGILNSDHEVFQDGTGSFAGVNSDRTFEVTSGTDLGGFGTIRSVRAVRYRPGQGALGRFSAAFDANAVPLSTQLAGMFVADNGLFFGYDGTSFGINRQTDGANEIQTLTITGADGTGGTAVVTLDGVPTNVTLTGGGTVQSNAAQIAATTFTGWDARQVDDTVIFFSTVGVGNRIGTFSYVAPVNGTGTFTETTQGADNVNNWVPQASWNLDVLDGSGGASNPSGMLLNPHVLNVYGIAYQWLGAGCLDFKVMNPETSQFIVVHRIQYSNADNLVPSLTNPALKLGWAAASLGSTGTSLTVIGSSASGFVQGPIITRRNPRAFSNTKIGIGTTSTNILSVRLGTTFGPFTNQQEIFPLIVTAAVEGAKPAQLSVLLNPTVGGTRNFQYLEEGNSAIEVDTAGTTVTGGKKLLSLALAKDGSTIINLKDLNFIMEAGDTLVVAMSALSGTTEVAASFTWIED